LRLGNERWWSRHGLRYGRLRHTCRQQAERIDVTVGIGGDPHSEMDVRRRCDRVGALAGDTDDGALRDDAAAQDARRGELQQCHRMAVGGLDRDRSATVRDRADE
jgi:hypothetical protein